MIDYDAELQSGDPSRVLQALYGLSGDDRGTQLSRQTVQLAPSLIASDDEDIAWRAILLFGLVKPTPSVSEALLEAARRWLSSERYVGLAAVDGIARLIGIRAVDPAEIDRLRGELNQLAELSASWLRQFNRMVDGSISYQKFVSSVGSES